MDRELSRNLDVRRDPFVLATGALGVVAALVHLPFLILDWFGSADAAWDAIVMVMWSQRDVLPTDVGVFVSERFRSSPLVVFAARQLLASGAVSISEVAIGLNWLHVPVTLALPAVLYILCHRSLARGESAAATLLFLTSPIVFQMRCYAFPTLPALLCLLLSALAVDRASRGDGFEPRWLAGAAGLLCLAVLLKTDVILISPGVLGVVAWAAAPRPARLRHAAVAAALPLLALGVWHFFCTSVAQGAPDTMSSFEDWSARWMLVTSGLTTRQNQINMMMATGVGSAIAIGLSLLAAIANPRVRWALAATLLCVMPNLLFWGMRAINSSRHSLWMVVPLCVLIAVALGRMIRPSGLRLALLLVIAVANYSLGPVRGTDFTAPSNWFRAARHEQSTVARLHRRHAAAIERTEGEPRVVFPRTGSNAWLVLAALSRADEARVQVRGLDWHLDLVIDGQPRKLWLSSPLGRKPDLREDGGGWVEMSVKEAGPWRPGRKNEGKAVGRKS